MGETSDAGDYTSNCQKFRKLSRILRLSEHPPKRILLQMRPRWAWLIFWDRPCIGFIRANLSEWLQLCFSQIWHSVPTLGLLSMITFSVWFVCVCCDSLHSLAISELWDTPWLLKSVSPSACDDGDRNTFKHILSFPSFRSAQLQIYGTSHWSSMPQQLWLAHRLSCQLPPQVQTMRSTTCLLQLWETGLSYLLVLPLSAWGAR